MTAVDEMTAACWVCSATKLRLVKESGLSAPLEHNAFKITDSNYGQTAAIYRCESCGFLQCADIGDVLEFYEALEDIDYEEGRDGRKLQAHKLLQSVMRWRSSGRLLDVGAGTGILVEEATELGFEAEGIEPSEWAQVQGSKHELKIHHGTLPHPDAQGPYDLVTLIDVIEHVDNPVVLLRQIRDVMSDDGLGVVVTPDVSSFAARLMGWKWWHYRTAHIGYFNDSTIRHALRESGLRVIAQSRPGWFFKADYLVERLARYFPPARYLLKLPGLSKITVPLNLFDSLLYVFEKDDVASHRT